MMKKQDDINQLFDRLADSFDTEVTPLNHERRFLDRLEAQKKETPEKKLFLISFWKPLAIAASLLLLVTIGINFQSANEELEGLASVSEEMENTETFFTAAIYKEIETLKSFNNEDTEILISNTLQRLELLETEYEQLKVDLSDSGNDKRVVAAMISNFQNRIDILEQVIDTIEEIETLKTNKNENLI